MAGNESISTTYGWTSTPRRRRARQSTRARPIPAARQTRASASPTPRPGSASPASSTAAASAPAARRRATAVSRGPHSFQVKARDAAGNESTPAGYGWTVDSAAPATPTSTLRPPDPSSSTPTRASASPTARLASPSAASFDGAGFSACTSPQSYSGLAEGSHSFQVKARDALDNESATADYSWTVDTQAPPSPTIDSTPPDPSSSTSANLSFSDSEAGVSFRCKLDGGALERVHVPEELYRPRRGRP